MDLFEYLKRELVLKASRRGLILTPEALEYLLYSVKDVDSVLDALARQGLTVVRLEDILGERAKEKEEVPERAREEAPTEEPPPPPEKVLECEPRFRVRLYVDPSEIEPPSWERERERILRNRLEELGAALKRRGNVAPVSYDRALRSEEPRDVLGIVLKVEQIPGGRTAIYVEDGEESAVIYYSGNRELQRKVSLLAPDSVAVFRVVSRNGRLYLNDLFFPGGAPPPAPPCSLRILVSSGVPENLPELSSSADAVIILPDVVNVYESFDLKEDYRRVDEVLSSLEVPTFVVPGPFDAVRRVPPHPPLEPDLLPESSASGNVTLLGSPALIRTNGIDILLYDGEYHRMSGHPLSSINSLLLIQPDISSFPYLSSRDYSLLKRPPHYILSPMSGRPAGGVVPLRGTYYLDLSEGKVMRVE